jgi:hypothetical protein
MKANIILSVGKVYDFSKADVSLGQQFAIEIDGDVPGDENAASWFSNNDAVLDVDSSDPRNVKIKATATGDSVLILMTNNTAVKEFAITVYDVSSAASLNPTAGTPVLK